MKDGAGRFLAAALGVAALCAGSSARGASELVGTATDSSGPNTAGWQTQRWPMHGQQGDQRRRISTEDFTVAYHRPYGSLMWPEAWRQQRGVGDSEVVTAFMPGLERIGPQASLVVSTGSALLGGCTTAAAWMLGGFTTFPSLCGSYVGTPILATESVPFPYSFQWGPNTIPIQVGLAQFFALSSCGLMVHGLLEAAYFSLPGGSPPTNLLFSGFEYSDSLSLDGYPRHSATMHNGIVYVATARGLSAVLTTYNGDHQSGILYALGTGVLGEPVRIQWTAALQIGSGSTGPLPKGQEPPPAAERFWATTPAAVADGLVVVGTEGWDENQNPVGHALFAFDADTGAQRWTYKVNAEILPTPAITDDLVIFGTRNGRVYAIQHNGTVAWQTSNADRVTYRELPFSTPQQFADAALYGPAIDQAGDGAYFGGSDGRVHRFDVNSGGRTSSEVLLYFRELIKWWWGQEPRRDHNGLEIIRPCPISSAPAIFRNKWLIVKNHTNTQWGTEAYGGASLDRNGAFLCVIKLPSLTMDPDVRNWSNGVTIDPGSRVFRNGGSTYGAIGLNDSGSSLKGFDSIHQVSYINDPGSGMDFAQGVQTDPGGVSIGDGYIFGTDGDGNIVAIPSDDHFEPAAGSGTIKPHDPSAGPGPDPGPRPLGPVEAFPNPFMPARAKGGTFKFRNLPMGSRVEIYTLAFERVKILQESDHRAEWNATNEAGQPVSTGVYLYKIFIPGDVPPLTGRVALTR